MRIVIVAFDRFTDLDVFLPWDLLNRVSTRPWTVSIVADTPTITSVAGLTIAAHGDLGSIASADAVVVASGPGLRAKLTDDAFVNAISLDPARQLVGSMCSGALLLARLGVLAGKRATTYPTARASLAAMGIDVVDEAFVREGNVATAAGCLAAVDLVGWIIESLVGVEQRDVVVGSVQPVGAPR
jgi:transcriptional regulator GlxA family with amidase domain